VVTTNQTDDPGQPESVSRSLTAKDSKGEKKMPDMNRRKLLATLAVAPLAAGVVGRAASLDNKFKVGVSTRDKLQKRYFPNLELTTHEGKKVRFYDDLIKDKIVVINFMYVKCKGVCMPVTMNLKRVQKLLGGRLGRDIFMYSITLKPEEDTPQALRRYVQAHKIKPGWTFLTGKPDEINILRRSLGFKDAKAKLDKDLTNHTGMVKYGNEARQWWAMFPGEANAPWIVECIEWMDGRNTQTTREAGQNETKRDNPGHIHSKVRNKG
jgi:protein SCO1/2